MNIPQDPVMLMSWVNTKLRDEYPNFEALCDDLQLDRRTIEEKLSAAGFEYMPVVNQFR